MVDMKVNEESILFGNAKDFKSDAIFDFVVLFTTFYLYKCKMGNTHPLNCPCIFKTTSNKVQTQRIFVACKYGTCLIPDQMVLLCYTPFILSDQNNG